MSGGYAIAADPIASAPAEYGALSSLVRALVRFHYDEWVYNGHWGGDEKPPTMLCSENPIVEHAGAPLAFHAMPANPKGSSWVFLILPDPDYDKGIAVYAGNDDQIGRLPPLDAIITPAPGATPLPLHLFRPHLGRRLFRWLLRLSVVGDAGSWEFAGGASCYTHDDLADRECELRVAVGSDLHIRCLRKYQQEWHQFVPTDLFVPDEPYDPDRQLDSNVRFE